MTLLNLAKAKGQTTPWNARRTTLLTGNGISWVINLDVYLRRYRIDFGAMIGPAGILRQAIGRCSRTAIAGLAEKSASVLARKACENYS